MAEPSALDVLREVYTNLSRASTREGDNRSDASARIEATGSAYATNLNGSVKAGRGTTGAINAHGGCGSSPTGAGAPTTQDAYAAAASAGSGTAAAAMGDDAVFSGFGGGAARRQPTFRGLQMHSPHTADDESVDGPGSPSLSEGGGSSSNGAADDVAAFGGKRLWPHADSRTRSGDGGGSSGGGRGGDSSHGGDGGDGSSKTRAAAAAAGGPSLGSG
ncbi:unnamed protein product, partial [Phaeothamnion confervicola]